MFKIKWIKRFDDCNPIEIEDGKLDDIDKLVAFYKGKLHAKRIGHISDPPDGFLICDENEQELRRWLTAPLRPTEPMAPAPSTSLPPSRRSRPKPARGPNIQGPL